MSHQLHREGTMTEHEDPTGLRTCPQCGAAVGDVRRHESWHRRTDRRAEEVRVFHDELDHLRDELHDAHPDSRGVARTET